MIQGATAIPLAVTFGVASGAKGGLGLGITVVAVVLSARMAPIELLTLTLPTVPCTCTYRPGQLRLRVLWPAYLTLWLLLRIGCQSTRYRRWATSAGPLS